MLFSHPISTILLHHKSFILIVHLFSPSDPTLPLDGLGFNIPFDSVVVDLFFGGDERQKC